MKKSYNVFKASNAITSHNFEGSYKKLDYKQSCSRVNKVPNEIGGAYLTKWSYLSLKTTSNSVSTALTLPSQASLIKHDQRLSVLQELNQALNKGEKEFVKVICPSYQKEDSKQKQAHVKSKNFLKILSKFFIRNQEEIVNQDSKCEIKKDDYLVNSFLI